MIVVAGGSGLLGQKLVARFLARGEQVRVLVRDVGRARTVLGGDVELEAVDIRRPAGLAEAVAGASVLVSAVHGLLGGAGAGPVEVDLQGNTHLFDAAEATGAHVVLVSVVGAAPDSALELGRAKYAAELRLRAGRTSWTIVRAGPFLETWLTLLAQTAGKSGRPVIFGRGDLPVPFVSASDVAMVVDHATTDSSLRDTMVEVAGEPLTMIGLAEALQAARGWHGALRHVPRPALRALGTLARPANPAFARKNRAAVAMDTVELTTSTDAADLLGRAPLRVCDVLRAPDPS